MACRYTPLAEEKSSCKELFIAACTSKLWVCGENVLGLAGKGNRLTLPETVTAASLGLEDEGMPLQVSPAERDPRWRSAAAAEDFLLLQTWQGGVWDSRTGLHSSRQASTARQLGFRGVWTPPLGVAQIAAGGSDQCEWRLLWGCAYVHGNPLHMQICS